MDLFGRLNYTYPRTRKAGPCTVYRSRGSQNTQSIQDQTHLENGHMHSNPGWTTHTGLPLDFTPGHDPRPQQRSNPVSPRGAVYSGLPGPIEAYYMDESTGLSDHYVPSSSDKITCTDHSPLDEIFGTIRPSQTISGSIHLPQNGTPRGHPRNVSVFTYPLPSKPQLDGVVQIPLLAVDNGIRGTDLIVNFRCSDWGIGVQVEGIPMSDLLRGDVSGLENPHQRVLDGLGLIHLQLNILWPHYPPFMKLISAFGTSRKPLTRAELGYEVSLAFAEFFYDITSRSISPTRPGPYTISSSAAGSPSPGIRYDQLHLITVRNTSCGEWVPEIRVVSMS